MKKVCKVFILTSLLIASCKNHYDVNNQENESNIDNLVINSEISNSQSNDYVSPSIYSSMSTSYEVDEDIVKKDLYEPLEDFDNIIENYSYLYKSAIEEKDNDIRTIKLAKAEEYLLDSCVVFPYKSDNLNYGITRVVPSSYLYYNSQPFSLDNLIVTNELLDKETINNLKNVESVEEYLLDNGYTFKDKANFFYYEEVNSLNIFSKINFDNKLILSQCQSSLFKIDNKGNLINDLCESYEVSDDGYTFTFTLKDNIYWYNYNLEIIDSIKAEDFVRGLKYYLENMSGNCKIEGAEEYLNNLHTFENVKIKANGEKQLSITLVEPNINLFYKISSYLFPLHEDNLNMFSLTDKEYSHKDLYYSGSYVIKEIVDKSFILRKNNNYHNSINVNLDEISFHYELIPSNSIIEKTIQGEYDHIRCSYNDKMYKLIVKNNLSKNIYYGFPGKLIINYGCFNLSKEYMNDFNLRKGLVYSLNKEKFISEDCDSNYINELVANTLTPDNIVKINNSDFINMNYGEIIRYFANKRDVKVDYSNTYNEELAQYYFDKFVNENEIIKEINLNIIVTKDDEAKVVGYLEDVKRLSSNFINFNIIVVNNQYDYYVMTNKREYDIILFNYWTPDYYDASAFLSPFIKGGEKNRILGI